MTLVPRRKNHRDLVLTLLAISATCGTLVFAPAAARAQVKHGAEINQVCVGPAAVDPGGQGVARPGDTFRCSVIVRNADEFGHQLRVGSIQLCTDHASGETCSGNLLPANSQGVCVGGSNDGATCTGQGNCSGGTCGVRLSALGNFTIVSDEDTVAIPDNNPLFVRAEAKGVDDGTGLDFELTISTPITVVQQFAVLPQAGPRGGELRHGGEIRKGCRGPAAQDPDQIGEGRPGDTITCNIQVTNRDDFGHAIRVNSIVDTLFHTGQPTTTSNLLPGTGLCIASLPNEVSCVSNAQCGGGRCSIGSTCIGGRNDGDACTTKDDCPDGTCSISPQCVGGSSDGAACTTQGDCPSPGKCTVILHELGDVVVATHMDTIRVGDPNPLPDMGAADAVDLGLEAAAAGGRSGRGASEQTAGLNLLFGALVKIKQTPVPTGRTPTPALTPTPGPSTKCGDADGNDSVSVTDGVQALRAAADLPSICDLQRCDLDRNGSISVVDGVNVLRLAASLPVAVLCP